MHWFSMNIQNASQHKSQYTSVLNKKPESIPIIILIEDSKMVKSNMPQHDIIKIKENTLVPSR